MKMVRVQIVLQDLKNPKLPEIVMSAYDDYKDNPSFINFIAWNLHEQFKSGCAGEQRVVEGESRCG